MRESTRPQGQGVVSLLDGEKARTSSIQLICSTRRSEPTGLHHPCDVRRIDIERPVFDLKLVGEGAEESAEAFRDELETVRTRKIMSFTRYKKLV